MPTKIIRLAGGKEKGLVHNGKDGLYGWYKWCFVGNYLTTKDKMWKKN